MLALALALALAIALALPCAGIAPLISIAVPAVAVAITVLVTLRPGERQAAWSAVGFGLPSWRSLLVAVVGPMAIVVLSFAIAAVINTAPTRGPVSAGRWPAARTAASLESTRSEPVHQVETAAIRSAEPCVTLSTPLAKML